MTTSRTECDPCNLCTCRISGNELCYCSLHLFGATKPPSWRALESCILSNPQLTAVTVQGHLMMPSQEASEGRGAFSTSPCRKIFKAAGHCHAAGPTHIAQRMFRALALILLACSSASAETPNLFGSKLHSNLRFLLHSAERRLSLELQPSLFKNIPMRAPKWGSKG